MNVNIPGYEIVRPIAEGGMASVYLAVQQSLGRYVALKLLRKFDTPGQAERFRNEGQIIASLNHRNIITIHDIGVYGEQHYISMEYLEGGDLEARIRDGIQPEAALELLQVMGGCLEFLHRQEIIHRDIKPANILFHKDGTPILTDFGVARQLESDIRLTMEGSAVGSPCYLSPEQAGCRMLDGRTDIYGLGIIFHEMLTGEKPYQGASPIETIVAHITEPLPVLPAAFARYQGLLERMIEKDPEDRFHSAGDMLAYIHALREGRVQASAAFGKLSWLRSLASPREPGSVDILRHDTVTTAERISRRISSCLPRAILRRRTAIAAALVLVAAAGLFGTLPSLLHRQMPNDTAQPALSLPPVDRHVMTVSAKTESGPAGTAATTYDAIPPPRHETLATTGVLPAVAPAPATGQETDSVAVISKAPAVQSTDGLTRNEERRLLQQARQALNDYRLTTPPQDNAYYYYRSVMAANPG